jgi:hypothetical protein
MNRFLLLLFTLPIIGCNNNNSNGKIELSYSFEKKEKKINLVLQNNTNEDFIVIVPKTLAFFNSKHSGDEKLEEYKDLNAKILNKENTVFSKQIDSINSSLIPSALPNTMESFPTAVLVKKKEKKQLEYKFNNNFTLNKEYKSSFSKMRDILNIPYNLEMVKKMLECRKDDQYKIYLDDFVIRDSIKVKF